MLTQVVVEQDPIDRINAVFDIDGVDPDAMLIITSISGLTSTNPVLFTGEFASSGGYYQGRRTGKRNVVITFKLNPNYATSLSADDIREYLYRTFHDPMYLTDGCKIILKDDVKADRYLVGYAETIDCTHFDKQQTATVSLLCPDFFIRSVASTSPSPAVPFYQQTLTYDGTADTGIDLILKVKSPTSRVAVTLGGQLLDLYRSFNTNDTIEIGTNIRDRYVRVNGFDNMAVLSSNSVFLQLRGTYNVLDSFGEAFGDNRVEVTNYAYRSAFWGI